MDFVLMLCDGALEVQFACTGATKCKFALCQLMPPGDDDECFFKDHGNCRSVDAQLDATNKASKKLTEYIKNLRNQQASE